MRRSGIPVAAYVVAAAWCWQPAQALPQGLPSAAHLAAPAPMLQTVRYHRYHRYYRHHDNGRRAAAADAAAIRPGQWEFAAQLEAAAFPPAGSDLSPAAASSSGGAMKSAYAICVAADNAVPSAFAPGCKIDALHRDGGRITWSMTCTNRQSAVRSDGVALYRGDTMEATMVSHLPNAKGGGKTDVAQHITGHYRGPCPAAGPAVAETEAPVIPPAAVEQAARPTEAPPASPAAGPAVPETEASAAPPAAPETTVRHRRYPGHRRHYAYRRRWYGGGYYGGGYSGFGPSPYSANGN